ncbi:MAG TPA: VOC family protein [Bacteroidota bacterium]|nr:VOC family protein [Bacteroidota bacterium]
MKRVTGVGGIFFKSSDPKTLGAWYDKHLGIPYNDWGAMFEWRDLDQPEKKGVTTWALFKKESKKFSPSDQPFMINYRVENLEELIPILRKEGVTVVGEIEKSEYGNFAWVLDPEGNKIELWEPPKE